MTAHAAALQLAPSRSPTLHVSLWIVQLLLFAMFAMAGVMKATQPLDTLVQTVNWAADIPLALTRFIGISEFAAAPVNIALGSLAAFVAWGRYRKAPIAPRGG